jgi:hypothetical protein
MLLMFFCTITIYTIFNESLTHCLFTFVILQEKTLIYVERKS